AENKIRPAPDRPKIVACDKDPKMCENLSKTISKYDLLSTIRVINNDFFNITPSDIYDFTGIDRPGVVIINPPYGVRLGSLKEGSELAIRIAEQLKNHFSGWRFALFSPETRAIEQANLRGDSIVINHGGLKLTLFTGVV
ncbi:MAG: hypothetical protein GX846_08215, partial [Deltaproteobacteria bacterium]|nr:hypothetical protein [Deltaproteobacteria bacterium]